MGHWKLCIAIFKALHMSWWLNVALAAEALSFIRSPKTLQRRCYRHEELEQWHTSFYTIVTNYNGPLEAVYRHIQSVAYVMVVECGAGGRSIELHQVTEDAAATLLQTRRA
eukprot:scaffold1799_cov83-Skeletonema_marinoi.AAC.2